MFLWKCAKLFFKKKKKSLTSWQTKNWQNNIAGSWRFRSQRPIHIMGRYTSLLNTFKQGEEASGSDKRGGMKPLHAHDSVQEIPPSLLGGFYKRLRAVSPHNAWVKTCKRNMKWGDKWELQPPDREWRRKNARWDGAEDPPLLRTRGEELTESLTEPVLTAIVWTEDLFADCWNRKMELFTSWVARAWITCAFVTFYAQVKTLAAQTPGGSFFSVLSFILTDTVESE